jgi:hypothetical protein
VLQHQPPPTIVEALINSSKANAKLKAAQDQVMQQCAVCVWPLRARLTLSPPPAPPPPAPPPTAPALSGAARRCTQGAPVELTQSQQWDNGNRAAEAPRLAEITAEAAPPLLGVRLPT